MREPAHITSSHSWFRRSRTGTQTTLLVDADDTLWENNIYFLEVTDHFCRLVGNFGVEETHARLRLTSVEKSNIPLHGYGSRTFSISLVETCRHLVPEAPETLLKQLEELAEAIWRRESLDILPGVPETLDHLSRYYQLILVTKGDRDEQLQKVERSGLSQYFVGIEVVAEKNAEVYRELVERWGLDPERTWMIGNSPRSDINPALEAGIGAVLVPHPHTWELELESLADHERRFTAPSFSALKTLFPAPRDRATGQ